ncbi:MAG: TlpA family protein disulfide reductase [Cyclobacteriaceae bacterium]
MNRLLYIIALILVLIGGCQQTSSDLSKIKLTELDGTPIDLTQYKGQIVFVNFWATWCKPCIQEMPTIARAQEQLANDPIVFLFPSNEEVELINSFKERRNFNFHYVQLQNMEELNIQALPTTFIINTDGKLVFSEAGYRDWSTPENLELIRNPKP